MQGFFILVALYSIRKPSYNLEYAMQTIKKDYWQLFVALFIFVFTIPCFAQEASRLSELPPLCKNELIAANELRSLKLRNQDAPFIRKAMHGEKFIGGLELASMG